MKKMPELHEIRKDVQDIGISLGVCAVIIMVAITVHIRAAHNKTMKKLDLIEKKMELMLKDRNTLDQAYKEHLKECAFISKDEVKVDGMGYFYSSYRRAGR
jgi:hypothetical protein